jgi:hypothetical protein
MKRTEIDTETVYAVSHNRVTRPAIILSTEPHELRWDSGTSTESSTYELKADSGHYRGYGKVGGGAWSRNRTHRGLPALIGNSKAMRDDPEQLRAHAAFGLNAHLGKLPNGVHIGEFEVAVVRPQDITQPWADHLAAEQARKTRHQEREDRVAAEKEQAERDHQRVLELLEQLEVEVAPALPQGYTREGVSVHRSSSWASLYKLLAKVAEAAVDHPELFQFTRD